MKRCCYVTLSSVIVEDSLYSIIFFVKIGSLMKLETYKQLLLPFCPNSFSVMSFS
jgi:hypothetical protein